MTGWEMFELDATDYLNYNYGDLACFEHQGGADSTVPDILVTTKSGRHFFLEAKCSAAQCGQFVLQPDVSLSTFIYTAKTPKNIYAQRIIDHMNNNFELYKNAGTSGVDIPLPESLFAEWIKKVYGDKNVKFFITDNFLLVPLDEFENYFTTTATFRVKRSGSSNAGGRKAREIIDYIKTLDIADYITEYAIEGTKLFAVSTHNIHEIRFVCGRYEYMFSRRGERYEVRKLANTFNANVIFSIKLKNKADKFRAEFIDLLNS